MKRLTCLEGGPAHTWTGGGLDVTDDDQLVYTRQCLHCPVKQQKAYGAGGRKAWRTVR